MAIRRLKVINNTFFIQQETAHGSVWNIYPWDRYIEFIDKLISIQGDPKILFDDDNCRRTAIICARLDGNCETLYDENMEIIPVLTVEESYMVPLISAVDTVILINSRDFSEIIRFETSSDFVTHTDIYSLPCLGWVRINDDNIVMAVDCPAIAPTGDSK